MPKSQSHKNHIRAAVPEGSLPQMEFGREICCSLANAESREWLVTNGMGGFASGTVAGLPTRRYHGLLVAALKPPLGRTLLVTKIEETVGTCSHPMACEVSHRAMPTIKVTTEAARGSATLAVMRERSGDGCSARLLWHTCACTTTPYAPASFLEPFATRLRSYGLGTAPEIFDGDAPFAPRGCIAQAWTVGELLRAWTAIVQRKRGTRRRSSWEQQSESDR
jgi:glycogen debranching enzyme